MTTSEIHRDFTRVEAGGGMGRGGMTTAAYTSKWGIQRLFNAHAGCMMIDEERYPFSA